METKAIKCSCCGAAYEGDIQDGFFVCNHCNTKSKIVEDNNTEIVVEPKVEEEEEEEIVLENGPATAIKDKMRKIKLMALATSVAVLVGGITNIIMKNNQPKEVNEQPKTNITNELNGDEILNVADYVATQYAKGELSREGATVLLEGAGITVDPYYFDNIDEALSGQRVSNSYEEKIETPVFNQNASNDGPSSPTEYVEPANVMRMSK